LGLFGAAWCSTSFAENKQQEGLKLISRAIELADVRSVGSPPLRMNAVFRKAGTDAGSRETYSEVWIRPEQWRRDVQAGNFQSSEVASGESKWLLDRNDNAGPEGAIPVQALDIRTWAPSKETKVRKIVDENRQGIQQRCVHLDTTYTIEVFCIDTNEGTLISLEWMSRAHPQSHFLYFFADYQKFGNRVFPRSIQCQKEGEEPIAIAISEISTETSADPSLFVPPPGAIQLANCLTAAMVPPRTEYSPDPVFPSHQHTDTGFVVLSLVVEPNGIPDHLQVAKSGGADFDNAALHAVEHWHFKPALCHDQPAAAKINVEVSFRR
jgi:TonB family protein